MPCSSTSNLSSTGRTKPRMDWCDETLGTNRTTEFRDSDQPTSRNNHIRLHTLYHRRQPSCRPLRWCSASAKRRLVCTKHKPDPPHPPRSNVLKTVANIRPATAVAHCKKGKGLVKINGKPLALVQPEILRFKVHTSPTPIPPSQTHTEYRSTNPS